MKNIKNKIENIEKAGVLDKKELKKLIKLKNKALKDKKLIIKD